MNDIEQTEWARRFKAGAPYQYQDALEIVQRLNWVTLEFRDDHSSKGDFLCAILPDVHPEFWLDATPTMEEAQQICASMGWAIKESSP